MTEPGPDLRIRPPVTPLEPDVVEKLSSGLSSCRDVAFAHLPEVEVMGRQGGPELVLFVWLVPDAVSSLRSALNLVSEAVARALPETQYVDVVILNSAPELLPEVEAAGCLLVEVDAEERRRALAAAAEMSSESSSDSTGSRWWPF